MPEVLRCAEVDLSVSGGLGGFVSILSRERQKEKVWIEDAVSGSW